MEKDKQCVKREKVSLTLTLVAGSMEKLLNKYGTDKNAEAIRKAVNEVLGIRNESFEIVDSNTTRQKRKVLAMELNTTPRKIKEVMDKNKCSIEDVKSFF